MYALTFEETEQEWKASSRCRDLASTMTELFFSDELVDIARAKAICANCEVSTECLSAALTRNEPWGVWGGQLIKSGRIVSTKRGRGRPPKNPRTEIRVEEFTMPEIIRRTA